MKIKGTVINPRKKFIKEHFGESAWGQVLNTSPSTSGSAEGNEFYFHVVLV